MYTTEYTNKKQIFRPWFIGIMYRLGVKCLVSWHWKSLVCAKSKQCIQWMYCEHEDTRITHLGFRNHITVHCYRRVEAESSVDW